MTKLEKDGVPNSGRRVLRVGRYLTFSGRY